MRFKLENLGSVGAVLTAAACPVCFPKLALVGAFLGLGFLAEYEVFFFYGAQVLIVIALLGHIVAYRSVKNIALLGLAVVSAALFFISIYVVVSESLSYVALAGVVIAMVWMMVESRRCSRCTVASA